MIQYEYSVRVRYSETDVMGYLHHSNYARYYENARWELLRSVGIPYRELEDMGYMLPVIGMEFKFIKAAVYDDLVRINTVLKCVEGPRITFTYRMYNKENELINKAEVNLAFMNKETRTACNPPAEFLDAICEVIPGGQCDC